MNSEGCLVSGFALLTNPAANQPDVGVIPKDIQTHGSLSRPNSCLPRLAKAAMADGAIPAKTKELIALGVAMTTQCPYCIEIHNKRARTAGCTEAEIAEAVLVAAALRAGGAVTHGTHCLD